ncbi:MAG: TonB-dependent receptor [Bacteroidales bacterium]
MPAYEKYQRLGNPNLKPEISSELEIGTDLRFFSNRIGVDLAYYKKENYRFDNVSQYCCVNWLQRGTANLGQITNDGIELALNITPVSTSNFTWDFTYLYNKADMVLDKLSEELGVSEYVINSAYETGCGHSG